MYGDIISFLFVQRFMSACVRRFQVLKSLVTLIKSDQSTGYLTGGFADADFIQQKENRLNTFFFFFFNGNFLPIFYIPVNLLASVMLNTVNVSQSEKCYNIIGWYKMLLLCFNYSNIQSMRF